MNSLTNSIVRFSRTLPKSALLRNSNLEKQCFHVAKANYTNISYLKYVASNMAMGGLMAYTQISNQIKGKKPRPQKELPKDTVILYQFPRASNTPSLSPYAVKLETWLRAAGIDYQNKFGMQRGSKGLIPFIKLNDETVDDSQRCIEYLSDIYEKDLNAHLTEEQRKIAHLIVKLTDDSMLWAMAMSRFKHNPNGMRDNDFPRLAFWNFQYRVTTAARYARYGNLSEEELFNGARKDLSALEVLLDGKKYFFSNEKPCDADFAVFGFTCQLLFNDSYFMNKFMKAECPNLVKHNQTIKETYWPDWNTQIRKPKKALPETN